MGKDFTFETSFGRILGSAHTGMFSYLNRLMREEGLPITPDQFRVLTHLWEKEGLKQHELATCTNRNRANVTRIIDILEKKEIVEGDLHPMIVGYIKYILPKRAGRFVNQQPVAPGNLSKTR